MYALNHGVPDILQEETFKEIKDFFALPQEEKMKIHVNKSATIKGYEALLETKLDENTRGGQHSPPCACHFNGTQAYSF